LADTDDEIAKPPQLLAPRFLRDAEGYVESARQLAAPQGGIVYNRPGPVYHLLCHAIELALKAYLAASGVPITTLANHIRHDLEVAFRCAQKHGFAPSEARFGEIVCVEISQPELFFAGSSFSSGAALQRKTSFLE
jgi:hypothetical protein